MSASATQGGHNIYLKPAFGRLLRSLAWKQSGPILKGKGK